MINLNESMGPGWDQIHEPWICRRHNYQRRYAAPYNSISQLFLHAKHSLDLIKMPTKYYQKSQRAIKLLSSQAFVYGRMDGRTDARLIPEPWW